MADFLDKAAGAIDSAKSTVIGKKAVETKNEAFQAIGDGRISEAAALYTRSIGEEVSYMSGKAMDVGRSAVDVGLGAIGALTSTFAPKADAATQQKMNKPGGDKSPKR